ncbi:uncharacterized protein LOC110987183 [Acanthaster planci]|uniref:Uncharacterized protein LOC110987183 n=1 Tax=Acanthaster planci TaxID=133434 RepID=A0A8B7ZI92_ACAPL|nr:uncharacterized protein LOC110987183 [Acanthaster planci]
MSWYSQAMMLCLFAIGASALFDEDIRHKPSICRRKAKSECDLGICERYVETECYHGVCSNHTGECVCAPCWTGDRCDILQNSHVPVFQQQTVIVDVDIKDTYSDDVIVKVGADDPDAEECSYLDSCPCANILYSIEEGNEDSLFMIDPRSGEIRLTRTQALKGLSQDAEFKLIISAKNPVHRTRVRRRLDHPADGSSDNASPTMVVLVTSSSPEKVETAAAHSRRRRSTSGVPTSETFTLEKLSPYTDVTDIKIGEKVPLRLVIWLPVQTTTMKVELLTPYESSAILVLCDPQFTHVGNNYPSFDSSSIRPEYYSHAGDFRYDRVVLDLGSVVNTGSNTADDVLNKIHLDFNVILQLNNATEYGESYMVSAAVSYGAGLSNVWSGGTAFSPVNDTNDWSTSSPVLTISGPDEMTTQSSAIFHFDLVLKNYVTDFYLDIVAEHYDSGNPVMKICEFQLTGKGDNYGCMPNELPRFSSVYDNATFDNATVLARLDFGEIVNTGLRAGNNSDDENKISTEAVVYITNSSNIVDGEKYWLGVTITVDGSKIYSNQQAITALTTPAPTMTVDPVIEFYAVDGYAVTIGGTVGFVVSIDIPENITSVFIVDLSMPYTASNGAVLSICRAEVVYVGYNLPCMQSMTPEFKREDGQNADYVQFNFGGITNLGRRHQTDDSKLKVLISAELMASHPDVSNGTEFEVTAGIRYEMADKDILWVSKAQITAVDYQHHEYSDNDKIPKFKIRNRGKDYYLYNNSAVSLNITVTIPPETTYTPVLLNITWTRPSSPTSQRRTASHTSTWWTWAW